MTEFNMVSGNCGMPARTIPVFASFQFKLNNFGLVGPNFKLLVAFGTLNARIKPKTTKTKAAGTRGKLRFFAFVVIAATLCGFGALVHNTINPLVIVKNNPSRSNQGRKLPIELDVYAANVNPFFAKLKPRPSCIPLIVATGVTRLNWSIIPLAPTMNTIIDTNIPAAMTSFKVNGFSDNATAAMVFIGCKGIGIPNRNPVKTLYTPVKINVVPKSNPCVMDKPNKSGKNVPKSPRLPFASRVENWSLMSRQFCRTTFVVFPIFEVKKLPKK